MKWVLVTFLALLRLQSVISSSNQTLLFSSCSNIGAKCNHNLPNLLTTLTSQASNTNFYNSSFGETPNQLFGLYLCRGNIDHLACNDCVNYAAKAILNDCLYGTDALYQFDQCMVRYSKQPFFSKLDLDSWGASWSTGNLTSNRIRFAEILGDAMNSLAIEAANNKCGEKFATKIVRLNRFKWLYAMAQCTWDLTASDCNKCLSKAIGVLPLLSYNGNSAKVYLSSCIIRFESYPFLKILKAQPTLAIQ